MIEPYVTPSEKELKSFGLIVGPLFALFFGYLFPTACEKDFLNYYIAIVFCDFFGLGNGAIIPYIFGAILFFGALINAKALIYIHKPWMILGGGIGFCISHIILFALFYGLFLPMGVMMRLVGKDPMMRRFDSSLESYRINKEPQDKDHMETPF